MEELLQKLGISPEQFQKVAMIVIKMAQENPEALQQLMQDEGALQQLAQQAGMDIQKLVQVIQVVMKLAQENPEALQQMLGGGQQQGQRQDPRQQQQQGRQNVYGE